MVTESILDREQAVGKDDLTCAVQQLALDNIHTLSKIEDLPTELVEHIASYLLCEYKAIREDEMFNDFGGCVRFHGFLEFRETSQTIRQRTRFLFARCFETHVVTFTDWNILRLLEMSYHEEVSSRVRSLVIIAPDPDHDTVYDDRDPVYIERLAIISRLADVHEWLRNNPVDISIMAATMKRLPLKSVFVAPSLVEQYPGDYRRRNWSVGRHPPTAIFNAMVLSRVRLEKFDMSIPDWGTYAGIRPIANYLNFVPVSSWVFENLTSITLVVGKPKCKPSSAIDL
jgi:hypothetical protein